MGTGELRERGWVDKREAKKEGKGRPAHVYFLDKSIDEIIEEIKEEEMERIEEIQVNLERMKHLVESALYFGLMAHLIFQPVAKFFRF